MKNNNNFWFKRRRYGYGWIPTTWQGMVVVISFIVIIFSSSVLLLKDVPENTYQSEVGVFLALVFLSTSVLIFITSKKGPQPKWRWGKKKSDNPQLDF